MIFRWKKKGDFAYQLVNPVTKSDLGSTSLYKQELSTLK